MTSDKCKLKSDGLQNRIRRLIFGLAGCVISVSASAVGLGEISVHSNLGEPFRATIPYSASATEPLANNCVSVRPASASSDFPTLKMPSIDVANGVIYLTSRVPVTEPMISAYVIVDCRGSSQLSREYLLFMSPATAPTQVASAPLLRTVRESTAPLATEPTTALPAVETTKPVETTSAVETINQVVEVAPPLANSSSNSSTIGLPIPEPSQTVSEVSSKPAEDSQAQVEQVAARAIETPAEAVDAYQEPDVTAENSVSEAQDRRTTSTVEAEVLFNAAANERVEQTSRTEPAADTAIVLDDLAETGVSAGEEQPSVEASPATGSDPASTNSENEADLAATAVQPVPVRQDPVASDAVPTTTAASEKSAPSQSFGSLVWWLAGSGIVILLGLIVLARRLLENKRKLKAKPFEDRAEAYIGDGQDTIATGASDMPESDDSPTVENPVLDLDLIDGTGFYQVPESEETPAINDLSQTAVDFELPEEELVESANDSEAAAEDETPAALAPVADLHVDPTLEADLLADKDSDYSISMVVDAAEAPQIDDATEFDLQAVEVALTDETAIRNESPQESLESPPTVAIDEQALEQDYEDELTATMALNEEAARIAEELALASPDGVDQSSPQAVESAAPATAAETPLLDELVANLDRSFPEGESDPANDATLADPPNSAKLV